MRYRIPSEGCHGALRDAEVLVDCYIKFREDLGPITFYLLPTIYYYLLLPTTTHDYHLLSPSTYFYLLLLTSIHRTCRRGCLPRPKARRRDSSREEDIRRAHSWRRMASVFGVLWLPRALCLLGLLGFTAILVPVTAAKQYRLCRAAMPSLSVRRKAGLCAADCKLVQDEYFF